MVYVGQTSSVGNLKRAVTAPGIYEFESNFPGRRLQYSYLMFQVSQQKWSSVLCHYKVTEILQDGTDSNGGDSGGISQECRLEYAALCPPDQIDQCLVNRLGRHVCINRPQIDPVMPPPPGDQGCELSFNQFVMAQPSFDWHGGEGTIDYPTNGACISQVQVDWPGCFPAKVTGLSIRESNGHIETINTNGQRNGIFNLPRNLRANSVDVIMSDPQRFRFIGCQVDLLVR